MWKRLDPRDGRRDSERERERAEREKEGMIEFIDLNYMNNSAHD